MVTTSLLALSLISAPTSRSAPRLEELAPKLNVIAKNFGGRLGYSLLTLKDGKQISYQGNERFPSASTIKTAVMVEAIRRVDAGTLKWSAKKKIDQDPSKKEASMWAYFLKDGTSLDVDGFVNLMVGVSDNTATIQLRDWLGTMSINKTMESLGLPNTKILGNAPKEETGILRLRRMFGMGMTTPNEMVKLFKLIHENKAASVAGCDRMLRVLGRQYWDDFIGYSVPNDIKVCSKSGAITRSRSDVAIVYSDNPYILAIYTDSQKDKRWSVDNEGDETIRKISTMIWSHLHPNRPYTPPVGAEKFAPTGGGVE